MVKALQMAASTGNPQRLCLRSWRQPCASVVASWPQQASESKMNHTQTHTPPVQALRKPLPQAMVDRLRGHFGDRFTTAQAVREHHGRDESPFPEMLPDAVVFANSTDDVVQVVRACDEFEVPLIPYGAGSSLEGHTLALHGGISLDVSGMNRVLSLNPEDLTVTVEPGVTRKQLNE